MAEPQSDPVHRLGLEAFSMTVDPDAPRVHLIGSLDVANAAHVAETIVALDCQVVDCRKLRFLDAAGASAFVAAHRHAEHQGHQLIFTGVGGAPLRVLEITGLDLELNLA
jgi:anti-anti-sigma factor